MSSVFYNTINNDNDYTSNIHLYPNIWLLGGDNTCNILYNRGVNPLELLQLPDYITISNDELTWTDNGSLSIPNGILQDITMNTKEFTISYWKKNTSSSSIANSYDFIMTNSSHIYFKVLSVPYSSNNIYCQLGNGNGIVQTLNIGLSGVNFGVFNHYCFVLKNDTLKVFVNNAMVGTVSITNLVFVPPSVNSYIHVGHNTNNVVFKDVRIWDREVSSYELYDSESTLIQYNFTNSSPAYLTGSCTDLDPYLYDSPYRSIQFNQNSYISIPTNIKSQYSVGNGFTISYWKYHTLTPSNNFELETNNYIKIKTYEVSIFNNKIKIPIDLVIDRWYHVAVTVLNNIGSLDLCVYIDGVKVSQSSLTDSSIVEPSSLSYMKFGQEGTRFQDFRLYKKALSEKEVYYQHMKWIIFAGVDYRNHRKQYNMDGNIEGYVDKSPLSLTYPGDTSDVLLWYKYNSSSPTNDGKISDRNGSSSGVSLGTGVNGARAALSGSTSFTDSNNLLMRECYDLGAITFWHKGASFQFSGMKMSINISNNQIVFGLEGISQTFTLTENLTDVGNWHHYAIVYNNSTELFVYVDGVLLKKVINNSFQRVAVPSGNTTCSISMTALQDFRIYGHGMDPYYISTIMESVSGYDIDDLEVMYKFHNNGYIKDYKNVNNEDHLSITDINGSVSVVSGHANLHGLSMSGSSQLSITNTENIKTLLKKLQTGFSVSFWAKNTIAFNIGDVIQVSVTGTTASFGLGNNQVSYTHNSANTYHHWTFVYDTMYNSEIGTYIGIYMDGYLMKDDMDTENIVALSDYVDNVNMDYRLSGDNNSVIEDFRIYSRKLKFREIQEVFYEFPEFKNHTDDLFLWYRFNNKQNIASESDEYQLITDKTPVYNDKHFYLDWGTNDTSVVSLKDNTSVNIEYVFTSPVDQYLEAIIFTRGRRHVLKWPSGSEKIRISGTGIWGEELDVLD